LVLPKDIFDRMQSRRDLTRRDDVYNPPPHDGTEPIFTRGSAMPHRDLSHPHYAFQINLWFPLIDLAENESLMFFPEAYYDYRERVELLSGSSSRGFEDDVRTVGARIAANPNPSEWGFGEPATRKLAFGDVYMFYCQQVHGSPVRGADTLRLSIELRAAGHSMDDNTGYRRTFSNINNFLPTNEVAFDTGIKRADLIADLTSDFSGRTNNAFARPADVDTCAQFYLNALFPTPLAARRAKEIGQPVDTFDLGLQVSRNLLDEIAKRCDGFPFAEDRYFVLARLFLRRAEYDAAADLIRKASEQSVSYFWQLHFTHLAVRAHCKELARATLERCRLLAEQTTIDEFPFAPALNIPPGSIIAILPEHALKAVAAMSRGIELQPSHNYGPDEWYRLDPRLFHPHNYLIRRHEYADFRRAGTLFLAIPTGQSFVAKDIVEGKIAPVCFGESIEELEYEYTKNREAFNGVATLSAAPREASFEELEQRLKEHIAEALRSVEDTIAERTGRIHSLEAAVEERAVRIASLEAARRRSIASRIGSIFRHLGVSPVWLSHIGQAARR
jgi:hypothetical protein